MSDPYVDLWDEAARESIPDYPGFRVLGNIGLGTWMTVAESMVIKERQNELARERGIA